MRRRVPVIITPYLSLITHYASRITFPLDPIDLLALINRDDYVQLLEGVEIGSILLTSNRAPAEWSELFGGPLLASADLDRLAHRAEVLVIAGISYRAQGRQRLEQEVQLGSYPVMVMLLLMCSALDRAAREKVVHLSRK